MESVTTIFQTDDYVGRFKEEYNTLMRRNNELALTIALAQTGKLPFEPKTPLDMLIEQLYLMDDYLHILEERAELEGIELP